MDGQREAARHCRACHRMCKLRRVAIRCDSSNLARLPSIACPNGLERPVSVCLHCTAHPALHRRTSITNLQAVSQAVLTFDYGLLLLPTNPSLETCSDLSPKGTLDRAHLMLTPCLAGHIERQEMQVRSSNQGISLSVAPHLPSHPSNGCARPSKRGNSA